MQTEVIELPLRDQLWAWFEKNRTQAVWGIIALAGVGLVGGFVIWHNGEKEVTASEALSNVSLPDAANGRANTASGFLKVAADYPSSTAGTRALLLGAAALFTEGKFAEAQAQFEKFTREYRTSPFVSQAALGIAASLDAQGKTNEATAAYKTLTERHPGQAVIPQAKFALARLYEAQGKPELARPLFEEISRGDPYASISSEAGMRLEEMKVKHPNLFPAPTPPPLTPTAVGSNASVFGAEVSSTPPVAPIAVGTNMAAPPAATNRAPVPPEKR